MSDAVFGTFDELMETVEADVEAICRALRALVLEVHPSAVEVVRLGDRAATYGVGPKKMSEGHTYVLPYQGHVNLGFYHGVDLDDPSGLLEGTGARMRHVKVRTIHEVERPALRHLIESALAERRDSLGV